MKNKLLFSILVILVMVPSVACALFNGKYYTLKIMRDVYEITTLRVEIANTVEERARGLMFRKELTDGHGMWFIFEDETTGPFTMNNTFIPLDIIFVDNNMEIVTIRKNTTPLLDRPIYADKPYRFVLEVPAGFADKWDLKLKYRVRMLTTN